MVQKVVLETWETRENGNKSWRSCKYFRPHLFFFFWGNVNMWFGIECNMTHMCQFPVYKRRDNPCLRCCVTFTNPPPALPPVTDWCLCGNFLPQISDHLAWRRILQMHIFADFSGSRTWKQKHRDGSASRRSLWIAAVVSTSRSCVPKWLEVFLRNGAPPAPSLSCPPRHDCTLLLISKVRAKEKLYWHHYGN